MDGEALRGAESVREDHRLPAVDPEYGPEPVVADIAALVGVEGHVHGVFEAFGDDQRAVGPGRDARGRPGRAVRRDGCGRRGAAP
ncbi:hypothetical protein GCM10010383_50530 [Streptomyces lomondensis]|uniref:Uncharacterized protein n=1 Tax=Streptomyces lomondensis TaxID=68229 RepID=A0ABQ2XFC7_9ACTN|nr:hypothetical protein GCM10010383_50530 [Streptomyces lomondensis]